MALSAVLVRRPCLRDTPYTHSVCEAAQRLQRGCALSHLTLAAAQESHDDRSTRDVAGVVGGEWGSGGGGFEAAETADEGNSNEGDGSSLGEMENGE